ncbi:MAG TPA: GntR family transcriptional regulator [Devosia sp.]|nr:GntR family transcriptional regulator [Devosia sp.]
MAINPITEVLSLRDRAYEEIKKNILGLGLEPGQFLSIGDLARQLSVSRTPVRDALIQLEREGWVKVLPFKGAYVSFISVKDVEDIFELLIVLDGQIARSAAGKFSDIDIEKAEALLARSRETIAAGRVADARKLGAEFHSLIESVADNQRMLDIIKQLRQQYVRIRHFASAVPDRVQLSYEQHSGVLEAIKAREPERAQKLMMEHQTSVRDSILATLKAMEERAPLKGTSSGKKPKVA